MAIQIIYSTSVAREAEDYEWFMLIGHHGGSGGQKITLIPKI